MLTAENRDRAQTISLVVMGVLAGTYLIYWLRPVLVPFVVALFIVSGVTPILHSLEVRLHVGRIYAAAITFIAGFVLLLAFGFSVTVSVNQLRENQDDYVRRIDEIMELGEEMIPQIRKAPYGPKSRDEEGEEADIDPDSPGAATDPESEDVDAANADTVLPGEEATETQQTQPTTQLAEQSEPTETASTSDPLVASTDAGSGEQDNAATPGTDKQATDKPKPPSPSGDFLDEFAQKGVSHVMQALAAMISTSLAVLIYVFFLLIGNPTSARTPLIQEIDMQIRSYLALKTVISVFTGFAFGFALFLFGVPMPFTFGVLAFLLNFIPNVGPIIASLLPVPLVILDPSGDILWMIAVITVTGGIQAISGNVVEPRLMGNSSDLHPVTILLGLMFWGMMWGIIGMFLATPMLAAVKIMLERFESTKPVADLMAGRWEAAELAFEGTGIESTLDAEAS